MRRRLRAALDAAGIHGVTPHAFRRTVATVLDRASGPELAAEMLGHTSSKITMQHYIEPDEAVNPVTADILESLAPREREEQPLKAMSGVAPKIEGMEFVTPAVQTDGMLADRRRLSPVPRLPDEAMLDARVHIAFISWARPVPHAEGGIRVCWVIVSHEEGLGFVERYSEGDGVHPMEQIVSGIGAVVDAAGGDAWVALSKKRVGVASMLHSAGVPVTRVMHEHNRAAERAIAFAASVHTRQQSVAAMLDWDFVSADDPGGKRVAPAPVRHWWPDHWDAQAREGLDVVVAADASADTFSGAAIAAITTAGDVALRTFESAAVVGELEVEAITLALELVRASGARSATILSDSQDAVVVARAIEHGLTPQDGYRGVSRAAIERLERAYGAVTVPVGFAKVLGHVGHPLNEAADLIAVSGRLATESPREQVESELVGRISSARASALAAAETADLVADIPVAARHGRSSGLTYSIADALAR